MRVVYCDGKITEPTEPPIQIGATELSFKRFTTIGSDHPRAAVCLSEIKKFGHGGRVKELQCVHFTLEPPIAFRILDNLDYGRSPIFVLHTVGPRLSTFRQRLNHAPLSVHLSHALLQKISIYWHNLNLERIR